MIVLTLVHGVKICICIFTNCISLVIFLPIIIVTIVTMLVPRRIPICFIVYGGRKLKGKFTPKTNRSCVKEGIIQETF